MKLVAVHQPQYLPWLGYFDKIDLCDVFCLLDTVQYKKNEYQNRNRIKTDKGWQWLTVPVSYRFPQRISEVKIPQGTLWARKHLEAIKTHYRKAPYYELHIGRLTSFFEQEWHKLVDVNEACVRLIMAMMGIECEVVLASKLPVESDHPTGRLIEIIRLFGGKRYLSGKDGPKYMDLELFEREGVRLLSQNFVHPAYPQCYGAFEPYMSMLDLLFNCGPSSLSVLRETRKKSIEATS